MAIVNAASLATNYFVMDMPDIQWTGLGSYDSVNVRVTITPLNGSTVQFVERYVPDGSGAVTLRGLAELMQPYVKPSPTDLASVNLTSSGVTIITVTRAQVAFALFDEEGNSVGSSRSCHVYYSNQRTNTYPGSIKKWLSRYSDRPLYKKQRVVASAFCFSGVSVNLRVFWEKNGEVQTANVVPTLTGSSATPPTDAFTLHYSMNDIASAIGNGCTDDSIRIVDVQLKNSGSVVDTIRYRVDRVQLPRHTMVAFTNCYGMFELEAFTGVDEESTTMEGEYAWMDDSYEKIAESDVTEHHLCAGHVTKEQRRSIEDISHSPKVAIVYKGEGSVLAPVDYEPMTVTGIEIPNRHPRTAPQTAYVTLRHAPRHHEVVSRGSGDSATYDDGIFDYTFDNSYN